MNDFGLGSRWQLNGLEKTVSLFANFDPTLPTLIAEPAQYISGVLHDLEAIFSFCVTGNLSLEMNDK